MPGATMPDVWERTKDGKIRKKVESEKLDDNILDLSKKCKITFNKSTGEVTALCRRETFDIARQANPVTKFTFELAPEQEKKTAEKEETEAKTEEKHQQGEEKEKHEDK